MMLSVLKASNVSCLTSSTKFNTGTSLHKLSVEGNRVKTDAQTLAALVFETVLYVLSV